jgi:ribonuclease E
MFLFRRKKENTGTAGEAVKKVAASQPEKKDGKSKVENLPKKAETVKTTGVSVKVPGSQPVKVSPAKSDKSPVEPAPGKVVIPASVIEQEEMAEELAAPVAAAEATAAVPEEVADGLLVPMNTGKLAEDENMLAIDLAEVIGKPAAAAANPAPVKESKEHKEQPAEEAVTPISSSGPASAKAETPAVVTAKNEVKPEAVKVEPPKPEPKPEVPKAEGPKPEAPKADAPKAEPAKKEGGDAAKKDNKDDVNNKDNLFSSLFNKTAEVEETPIDRLIKSLPDITIDEVMNEAEEVTGLITELQSHNK